jgi:hypothetical protein
MKDIVTIAIQEKKVGLAMWLEELCRAANSGQNGKNTWFHSVIPPERGEMGALNIRIDARPLVILISVREQLCTKGKMAR